MKASSWWKEVKKEKKCKGNVYIGLGFCKGDANDANERGFIANRREDECPSSWPLGRPWEREREMH